MRLFFLFALSCSVFFSFAQNVGINVPAPMNPLHVSSLPAGNPLRIEGVVGGATTDSILTLNPQGVVRKRTVASVLGSGTGWLLTGNVLATNTGTSFLGSTNATSLFFRTNNQRSGFIDFDETRRNNSFGNRALLNPTGVGNNAFGYQALSAITTGSNNVAFGDSAGFSLTTGTDNTVIGSDAGVLLGNGFQNISIGSRSLAAGVAASDNIAIGVRSLENNDASANIAIGTQALNKMNFGSNNIGIGSNALGLASGTSNFNIAIGNSALSGAATSVEQIALGYNTGLSLTNGSFNTLLGHYNFSAATGGLYNTMVGYQVGANITGAASNNNTFVGYQAGNSQTGGSGNNTYIGYLAGPATAPATFTNSTALGSGAIVTQSNMVRLGNTSTTVIGGSVNYSVFSDERVKTNVQEDVKGLAFISLLRPVTYHYDLQKMDDIMQVKQLARTPYGEKIHVRYSGFLAQEVEKAAQQTGYNFSGVNKPQNDQSLYSINYSEIVVPLVKAVQELKAMVEKQQQEIERLKTQIQTTDNGRQTTK